MDLTFSAHIDVAATRERIIELAHASDLETVRAFDPRVVAVESNGVPEGTAGQVARVTAVVAGKRTVMTITTLEAELPDFVVERYEGEGPMNETRTTYTPLPDGGTRITMTTTFTVPWWKPLLALGLRVVAPRSMRDSLANVKALVEPPSS